jgi:flagellar biosynthetic protein FliO
MHMKRFVFRRDDPTARTSTARKLLQVATALPCAALAQGAASEPTAGGGLGWFGGELLLLALVAACAWTAIYVLKRKRQLATGGGNDERVHVLGSTSLGVRERVVVLRVRERTLLVGVTAAQVTLLADLGTQPSSRSAADAVRAHGETSA